MPLERPEPGITWLHVPLSGSVEVVVVGDIHTWHTHWTGAQGGRRNNAVRCVRGDGLFCAWCEAQIGRRARYVFPVLKDGKPNLVEFGRVQYNTLALLYDVKPWLGKRLRISRTHAAKNAEILIDYVGREVITPEMEMDIADIVDTLGRDNLRFYKPPQPTPSEAGGQTRSVVEAQKPERSTWDRK